MVYFWKLRLDGEFIIKSIATMFLIYYWFIFVMDREDYVSLLEVRCKFYTDHDYVPVRGGNPIFVPANMDEKIFFRLVVPDFDAEKAQLTGSRVYIAKLCDE